MRPSGSFGRNDLKGAHKNRSSVLLQHIKVRHFTLKISLLIVICIGSMLLLDCASKKNYCGRPPLGIDKYLPVGSDASMPINTCVDPPTKLMESPDYNDPYWSYQWHLQKDYMNISEAHKITIGDPTVIAWVIDTGVDTGPSDFKGVNFIRGHDYIHNNEDPKDDHFHGTSIASIICMQPNNNIGGVGVAPGVSMGIIKVLPLNSHESAKSRLFGASPVILAKAIIEATDYCVKNHRPGVINMSLGDYRPFRNEEILRKAILYARKNGILTICSAGNNGFMMNRTGWPSGYPEVISVGATTHNNFLAPYSNYQIGLNLCAPGGADTINEEHGSTTYGILCSRENNFYLDIKTGTRKFYKIPEEELSYFMITGTSAAAPQVSGTVALILSLGIDDPDVIMNIIYATLHRYDYYSPCFYGRGILDTGAAVKLAEQIKCQEVSLEQLSKMPKGYTLEETLSLEEQKRWKFKTLDLTDEQLSKAIELIRKMPVEKSDQY